MKESVCKQTFIDGKVDKFTIDKIPTVSIIIPSYKPGEYLYDCLKSVYSQTLDKNEYEILIILNGPKEPYYSQIVNYIKSKHLNNLSLLYSEHAGVSNARNLGIDYSRGQYIAFVDDDDLISENYIEELLDISSPKTVSFSNIQSFRKTIGDDINQFFLCRYYKKKDCLSHTFFNFRGYFAVPVAKLLHKDIIRHHRFNTNFNYGEDTLFMTSIAHNISNFVFTNSNVIYHVRLRSDSVTQKKQSIGSIIILTTRLCFQYFILFIKTGSICKTKFYLSRCIGAWKNAFFLINNQKKHI